MNTLPRRIPRLGLALAAGLTALGLASCSAAGGSAPSQDAAASSTPSSTGAPSSQSSPAASSSPSGSGAASGPASGSTGQAAAPSGTPVPSATVKAKGDAAKDAPAGWPSTYRVPTKKENTGLDSALAAQKKATQIPAAVAKEAATASDAPRPTPPDFGPSVEGAALEELQGDYVEAAQNGWVTTGAPVLKGEPRVVDLGASKVRVFACIDYSSVEMKDASGKVMQAATPAGTRARLQIYDMTNKGVRYVITSHQVAAEHPEC